ncbi:MAG: hypothetical protein A4S09_11335 [Proteobacteria bacterium SG_bin7]|nr:MAG: hypothetical protein A4S09_11335 [Proteobacteria bacterium SG_bin7]
MKKIFMVIVLIFAQNSFAETMTLRFKSMTQAKGVIRWAMYAPGEEWPGENSASYGGVVEVSSLDIVTKVPNVKFGTYAIASYQDVNNNGKMDKRLGFPLEPFGFSNGARPTIMGAPSYDKAKFEFTNESQVVDIDIKPF